MKNKKTLKVKNWKSSLFFILFFIFIITSQEALAGDFYTVDAKNPTIRKIDSTTLNTTETITVSVDGEQVNGFNGASVDTGTGDVYVVLSLDGYSDRHLAIVEMGTGDMTLVGSLGDKFAAIAFDAVGQLYGLTGDGADTPASLYSINKNTAEKTLLASYTASSDGEVLAFNNDDSFFYRATGDDLYAIDVNDPTNLITVLEDDSSLPGPEGLFHRENDSFYYIDWDELLDLDSTSGATFINDLDVGTKGMFEWPIDIGPAPSIYYPKDEDFNVPADSNFSITFDREVYAGIGNVEVRILSDDSVIESIDITSDQIVGWGTEEITIDPINILPADTSVYINIDSGAIKDGDDLIYGGISNSSTWSFTTISNGDDFVFEEIFNLNDFVDYDEMNVDIINEEGIVKLSASQLWDPYNVSSILSNEANESMRVVLDSLKRPIVCWVYDSTPEYIFISRWNGTEWTQMDGVTSGYEQVVRVDNYLTSLKMTIDSSDNPIIVYGGSRNIFISRWNGTEWTQMDEVTSGFENISNNDNAESPMVKLDNHGLPVVFWSDDIAGDGDIFISRWNGTEWTQMDEVTSGYEIIYSNGGTGDVYVTDLLFNEDNYPILSWAERMISGGGAYDIFISRWNGSEWTQMDGVTSGHENISNTTNESSLQGSIAMNSFGDIFATWQDTIGGRNVILVVFWNGVAWTQMNGITPGYEIVSDPTVHSYWPSGISFDDLGNPVLAWHTYTDGTYQIAVSRWNGTEWTQMDGVSSGYDLVSNSDNDSEFVSLITDDMNYPVVSWVEDSGFIFISRWNGSSWTQMDSSTPGYEKVLDASSVTMNGERPQILLGDNNNPIVGWRDNSSGHYRIKTSFYDPIYISPAIIQSTKISGLLEDEILRATLEAEDSTPGASRIEYFLSNDGGSTWEEVENGAEHIFSTVGNDLRWKAILYKGSTPTISSVTINYSIESEEDDDDQGEDQQADEPEEDPDPTIKIKEIKENCDFLEIEISTGGEQEHEKLDFKVKIEKTETGEKTEQKIEDFKTDSHGRALLTIDNLEQNTEYKIKVKYKEDDEYTEYSDSKKATTETCQSTQQTVLITEITEDDPISFPGELETQEEQEYVKEEDKQNKEEPTLTIQKEAKTETKEEDPKTKGFWNTLLGGGSSDTEGNSFTKVLAAAIAVVGGVSITTGAWLGRRKLLAFMGFTWMKKRKWRVFDVETGEPIPDVTVILESPEGEILEEEQTDEKGHFKFNASPGNNIIKVSKENYQMIERQEQEIIEEYGEIYTGGSLNNNRDVSLNINIPMRRTREIE